jgi:hypothetical protein
LAVPGGVEQWLKAGYHMGAIFESKKKSKKNVNLGNFSLTEGGKCDKNVYIDGFCCFSFILYEASMVPGQLSSSVLDRGKVGVR